MRKLCPKCGHVNHQATGAPMEECPACGVIYDKARPADAAMARPRPTAEQQAAVNAALGKAALTLLGLGAVAWLAWSLVSWWPSEAEQAATRAQLEQQTAERLAAEQRARQLDAVALRVEIARQAEARYEIARRNGTPMDACVHAGFVKAAWLETGIADTYAYWTQRTTDECARAGLPR